jgi:hypothetical protein
VIGLHASFNHVGPPLPPVFVELYSDKSTRLLIDSPRTEANDLVTAILLVHVIAIVSRSVERTLRIPLNK